MIKKILYLNIKFYLPLPSKYHVSGTVLGFFQKLILISFLSVNLHTSPSAQGADDKRTVLFTTC